MKLTENFNIDEFACNDGTPVPEKYYDNARELAKNLQELRNYLGIPIIGNSVYRHKAYNSKIGGKPKSMHLYCKAFDIRANSKFTPKKIAAAIEHLITIGKMKEGGIGIYNSFVHYDIRGTKARW